MNRTQQWAEIAQRAAARKQAIARDIAAARPFVAPPCARCKAPLTDAKGDPRWDVIGQLTFVCLGGCPSPDVASKAVRKAARKAMRS